MWSERAPDQEDILEKGICRNSDFSDAILIYYSLLYKFNVILCKVGG